MTFWANNLTETNFEKLLQLNNTKVEDGENRKWSELSPLINGWGQMIFYKVSEPQFFPGTTEFDPTHPESNDFLKVYEGNF